MLQRALQYASTFGYTVWLRPQDRDLGQGRCRRAARSPRAWACRACPWRRRPSRIFTIIELMRATGARVHLCRICRARPAWRWCARPRPKGLPLTCDVSINSLHLADTDIGYFDSRARLNPPLRQQRDREALSAALADGTIDALVSDHTPGRGRRQDAALRRSEPGATGLELLLPLALQWGGRSGAGLPRAIEVVTSAPRACCA